jgi:hypothetical protein
MDEREACHALALRCATQSGQPHGDTAARRVAFAIAKRVTQVNDGCFESGARRATETAALAKRVDALEQRLDGRVDSLCADFERLAQDSATQNAMADLQNKVAKLDDWSYRIVGEFLKWQARLAALEHSAAAPPPPDLDADETKRVLNIIAKPPAPTEALKAAMARTAPPPPEAATNCYDIACRYYGQRHATPHEPPEAAGPGHAWFCVGGEHDGCNPRHVCGACGIARSVHAVPPIPEGAKP